MPETNAWHPLRDTKIQKHLWPHKNQILSKQPHQPSKIVPIFHTTVTTTGVQWSVQGKAPAQTDQADRSPHLSRLSLNHFVARSLSSVESLKKGSWDGWQEHDKTNKKEKEEKQYEHMWVTIHIKDPKTSKTTLITLYYQFSPWKRFLLWCFNPERSRTLIGEQTEWMGIAGQEAHLSRASHGSQAEVEELWGALKFPTFCNRMEHQTSGKYRCVLLFDCLIHGPTTQWHNWTRLWSFAGTSSWNNASGVLDSASSNGFRMYEVPCPRSGCQRAFRSLQVSGSQLLNGWRRHAVHQLVPDGFTKPVVSLSHESHQKV